MNTTEPLSTRNSWATNRRGCPAEQTSFVWASFQQLNVREGRCYGSFPTISRQFSRQSEDHNLGFFSVVLEEGFLKLQNLDSSHVPLSRRRMRSKQRCRVQLFRQKSSIILFAILYTRLGERPRRLSGGGGAACERGGVIRFLS